MKKYIPNPVDTEQIQLPKELEYLVEEMAKNVHEVWSKTRIEQGWTYGEKRDDVLDTKWTGTDMQHKAYRNRKCELVNQALIRYNERRKLETMREADDV